MIPLTLAEIAAATGGRICGGADPASIVTGPVVADSRAVVPGALFVTLPGERVDGHDFAAAALRAGAVAVLAGRVVDGPAVVVDDPLLALGALAGAVLERLADAGTGLTVVGVTGSSGKTSTKDLIAELLRPLGETVATQGSFNNELGLPLTALQCTARTRFLVAEMGARKPGHIAYLCRITHPRIGVVVNVGRAHAGAFGSIEATAATKGELPEALPADGLAVLNADDAASAAMAGRTQARVVSTGTSPQAQVRAEDITLDSAARPSFRLCTPAGDADVALRLHGAHNVGNALAAAAVGLELGLTPVTVADVLSAALPASRWRMEVIERDDGLVVVNDAFNANPDSVRAALNALAAMGAGRTTWAVLGEMVELGDTSVAEHEAIGRHAAALGITNVVAVGEVARPVAPAAAGPGTTSSWVPDREAAVTLLNEQARPGDVVLVKASRLMGLDQLVTGLLDQRPSHQEESL